MKKIIILFFLNCSLFSFAQISDDFEDGSMIDWTQNNPGRWAASTDNPLNGLYSLHHVYDNSISDHDQISIPFGTYNINSETTCWRFQIRHSYSPSYSNNWTFFPFIDQNSLYMHPDSLINGYVFGVNYTGSDDFIKLWRIDNGTLVEIINTGINWQTEIGISSVVGFELKRTISGLWSIYMDESGAFDNLTQIGSSIIDTDHSTTAFLGFHYEYSSAQDMKLWIDDVYMGPEIPDIDPPFIMSLEASSNNILLVKFNEELSLISAEETSNYSLNSGIGNPVSANRDPVEHKHVELLFSQTFTDDQIYELTIEGVEDLAGNSLISENASFSYTHITPIYVQAITTIQVDIHFNKAIDPVSVGMLTNYSVNNGIGNPIAAVLNGDDNKLIHLSFSEEFAQEQLYTIVIENITDTYGNTIQPTSLNYILHIVQPFDLIINEIMCDINPPPDPILPPSKYIEVYNTSNFDLNISNWTLQIGDNSQKTFPEIILPGGGYAIVCDDTDETAFSGFGTVIPVLIPSEITTTGKRIIIRNQEGMIIEDLTYSKEWYDDEDKDSGGWSLERIDPENFCGEDDNWTAYDDDQLNFGGTPGSMNSVKASNIDNVSPELLDINIIASNYLILRFNENISYESGNNVLNFTIDNGINNPFDSYTNLEDRKEIHLKFTKQFQHKQNYLIMVESLSDNCDNIMSTTGIEFTYYRIFPEYISLINDKNLKVKFSETVEFSSGTDENNYFCNFDIGNPVLAVRESTDSSTIYLQFEKPFPDGIVSTLSISNLKDINGNKMYGVDMSFTWYLPKENDIVINEVLFDPYPNGVDFIELYNNSDYDIDLSHIQIAKREEKHSGNISSVCQLSNKNLTVKPGEYTAFTESPDDIHVFYMSMNEHNIIKIEDLPTFPDDSGTVIILYKSETILDEFNYNDDMHFRLLKDKEGVSLERVNPKKDTQDPTNWHSASETVGFATPAYENSQYNDGIDPKDDPVYVDPYMFSPDNDGMDDYANIYWQFPEPGYIATVYIFDSKGRVVKQLANNMILSLKGNMVWDGLYTDNRISPAGTYLIWFRINDLKGNVYLHKKTVVLAKKY